MAELSALETQLNTYLVLEEAAEAVRSRADDEDS